MMPRPREKRRLNDEKENIPEVITIYDSSADDEMDTDLTPAQRLISDLAKIQGGTRKPSLKDVRKMAQLCRMELKSLSEGRIGENLGSMELQGFIQLLEHREFSAVAFSDIVSERWMSLVSGYIVAMVPFVTAQDFVNSMMQTVAKILQLSEKIQLKYLLEFIQLLLVLAEPFKEGGKQILFFDDLIPPSDQRIQAGELFLEHLELNLGNPEECRRLQNWICSLLFSTVGVIKKHLRNDSKPLIILISALLRQLETGRMHLKVMTLRLILQLISRNLCPTKMIQFVVDHILAFFELLVTSRDRLDCGDLVKAVVSEVSRDMGNMFSEPDEKMLEHLSPSLVMQWCSQLQPLVFVEQCGLQKLSHNVTEDALHLLRGFFRTLAAFPPSVSASIYTKHSLLTIFAISETMTGLDLVRLASATLEALVKHSDVEIPQEIQEEVCPSQDHSSRLGKEAIIVLFREVCENLGSEGNRRSGVCKLLLLVKATIDTLQRMIKSTGRDFLVDLAVKESEFAVGPGGLVTVLDVCCKVKDVEVAQKCLEIAGHLASISWLGIDLPDKTRAGLVDILSLPFSTAKDLNSDFATSVDFQNLKWQGSTFLADDELKRTSLSYFGAFSEDAEQMAVFEVYRTVLSGSVLGIRTAMENLPLLIHNASSKIKADDLLKKVRSYITDPSGHVLLESALESLAASVCAKSPSFNVELIDLLPSMACKSCSERNPEKGVKVPYDKALISSTVWLLKRGKQLTTEVKQALCKLILSAICHFDWEQEAGGLEKFLKESLWLMTDPVYCVRDSFCTCLDALSPLLTVPELGSNIIEKLNSLSATSDDNLVDSHLSFLGVLIRRSPDQLLRKFLLQLFVMQVFDYEGEMDVCKEHIRNAAIARGLSPMQFYRRHYNFICMHWTRQLFVTLQSLNPHREARIREIVRKRARDTATLFLFNNVQEWLSVSVKRLVPQIVSERSKSASLVLDTIAAQHGLPMNKKLLLQSCFPTTLIFAISSENYEEIIDFILKEGGWANLGDLITWTGEACIKELVLHLGEKRNSRILTHIEKIANLATTSKLSLKEILEERIVSILMRFQECLSEEEPIEEKAKAIASLVLVLQQIGVSYFENIRYKAFNVLRDATQWPQIQQEVGTGWLTFCKRVPNLTPLLPLLFVTVVPVLDKEVIESLLNCAFELCSTQMKNATDARDLCFLLSSLSPDMDSFVRSKFRDYMYSTLQEKVAACVRLLSMDQFYVKKAVLTELLSLLQKFHAEIYTLIINSSQLDPIIPDLALILLETLRTCDDVQVRRLGAECLGQLGAVDPGRLGLELSAPTHPGRVPIDRRPPLIAYPTFVPNQPFKSWEFATVLIQMLGKALLASEDPTSFNLCSYTIQRILLTLTGEESSERERSRLMLHLPPHVRTLVMPLLRSKYATKNCQLDRLHPKRPLYDSAKSFGEWLHSWILAACKDISHRIASELYSACSYWAQCDTSFAQHILPFAILQSLIDCESTRSDADTRTEMFAVLKSCSPENGKDASFRERATQTVFAIYDFLTIWLVRTERSVDAKKMKKATEKVREFLGIIRNDWIAKAATFVHSYARSLMNIELDSTNASVDLSKIQELYSLLGEGDGVSGALRCIQKTGEPSSAEWILAYNSTGDYTSALPYHETLVKSASADSQALYQLEHVRCLLRINQVELAKSCVSQIAEHGVHERDRVQLESVQAETAWKLSDWSSVASIASSKRPCSDWNLMLGNLLISFKQEEWGRVQSLVKESRDTLVSSIVSSGIGSGFYETAYPHVAKLHMLAEIEQLCEFRCNLQPQAGGLAVNAPYLLSVWKQRSNIVQPSTNVLEPLLEVRRNFLNLCPPQKDLLEFTQKCWLNSARLSRKAKHLQTAWSFLVKAKQECPGVKVPDIFMEEAKYHYAKGMKDDAIRILQTGIKDHFSGGLASMTEENKAAYSHSLTLLAWYSEEAGGLPGKKILNLYKTAESAFSKTEHLHYRTACFVEKLYAQDLMMMAEKGERNEKQSKKGKDKESAAIFWVKSLIDHYARSLEHGSRFLRHSLPRILTLWMNLGSDIEQKKLAVVAESEKALKRTLVEGERKKLVEPFDVDMNKITCQVENIFNRGPEHHFYVVFSQLISRIGHRSVSVNELIKKMIQTLTVAFPDQCLWLSIGAYRAKNPKKDKGEHVKDIRSRLSKSDIKMKMKLAELDSFASELMKLANKKMSSCGGKNSLRRSCSGLTAFFEQKRDILIPLQRMMEFHRVQPVAQSQAPAEEFMETQDLQSHLIDTTPSSQPIYIHNIEDEFTILPSLARPKKIIMRGSDGKAYPMMCKPKDDMRKDKRLMELVSAVNSCLREDAESRKRQLHIRSYTVTPLEENGGLVEWVNNLQSLRSALEETAARKGGPGIPSKEFMEKVRITPEDSMEKKLALFDKTLARYPEMYLGAWFRDNFPDPSGWYIARLAFTRTTAVMSMVGFILGLGDRHSENLLIDETCGDVFHVDFNLLFNQGETLKVKEVVPFRLTRNMVDGFGPLGVEGIFRRSCEVSLGVLRDNREMLLSVLDTFVHDPLLELGSDNRSQQHSESDPNPPTQNTMATEQAGRVIESIDRRLRGIICSLHDGNKKRSQTEQVNLSLQSLPLSTEGQVDRLITIATDRTFLAQMFHGWMPAL